MTQQTINELSVAEQQAAFKYDVVPYTRGRGIQVLSSECPKFYEHFIGAENQHQRLFASRVMDFVVAYDVEDLDIAGWFRIVKNNGHLVLCQKTNALDNLIQQNECRVIIDKQVGELHYQVFRRTNSHKPEGPSLKPAKTVCVVRYGGFGDMIQTSSILPGLKDQGYYVTVNTDPAGYEIMQHDPHVDEFLLQDKDQVPNAELGPYWQHLSSKYDKFVNLSESVEGTLLALPGRIAYLWPQSVRHDMLNINYLEFTHKLAGVPMPPQQRFYATKKEKQWADKQRKKMDAAILILWVLSGSSVHKAWPYLDTVIARLMLTRPDVKVVLVGDGLCQMLEIGWENEPRVIQKCGKWSIRETLTFAELADIVIGPETGVLNAVGQLPVAKVVCLSHSTTENLSKHWVNCISLEPENCPCYPCHRMCYGFDPCIKDTETGVALCQARISAEQMWQAINKQLEGKS